MPAAPAPRAHPTLPPGVINLFEERLKQQHPHVRNITYDVADLNLYIDNLTDLSALVYVHARPRVPAYTLASFNPQTSAYDPFNKAWIKGRILQFLKRQAGQ